jgi:hypothetical protein
MSRWHLSSRQKRIGHLLPLFVHATHLGVSAHRAFSEDTDGVSDVN